MTKENFIRKIKEQMNVARGLNIEVGKIEKVIGASDSLKFENIDTFDKIDETYDYKSLVRAIEILDDMIKLSTKALNAYLDCFNNHTVEMLEKCKEVSENER